jgi:hypothetical protein
VSAEIIPFPVKSPADPLDCPAAVFAVRRLLEFVSYDQEHGNVRPVSEYQEILHDGIEMAKR